MAGPCVCEALRPWKVQPAGASQSVPYVHIWRAERAFCPTEEALPAGKGLLAVRDGWMVWTGPSGSLGSELEWKPILLEMVRNGVFQHMKKHPGGPSVPLHLAYPVFSWTVAWKHDLSHALQKLKCFVNTHQHFIVSFQ